MPGVGFEEIGIQSFSHSHCVVKDPFFAGNGKQGDDETSSCGYWKISSIFKALIAVIEQDGGGTEKHDSHADCAQGFKATMAIGMLFVGGRVRKTCQ